MSEKMQQMPDVQFTNRLTRDDNQTYRWYYDLEYGRGMNESMLSMLCGGMMVVLAILAAVFMPAEKENKSFVVWSVGIIGVLWALAGWIINRMKYRQRGWTRRLRYILEPGKVTQLYDNRTTPGLKAVGRALQVTDILSGVPADTADRAELTGEPASSELPLDQVTGVILDFNKELILLRRGAMRLPLYICSSDFPALKEYILAHVSPSASVKER